MTINNTPASLDEIRYSVSERVEEERKRWGSEQGPEVESSHTFTSEEILKGLESNEDGDAGLFVRLHRNRFCFDCAAGRWYKWSGHFWEEDTLNEATRVIEALVDIYAQEARRQAWNRVKREKAGKKDEAQKHSATETTLLKRVRNLQTKARKENILFLAHTGAASLGITGQGWDLDPWLLGCLNGVIDLQTGEHRPGLPENFIKTVAPTEWRGLNEPAPTWEQFLFQVYDGNSDLKTYDQRLSGYCITGRTTEHILPIYQGVGRNGKGTRFETLHYVLGDYCGQIEPEMILRQREARRSGGATSDIMSLRGRRFVWGSEVDEGRRLNAGRVKWLTGGDTLVGREVFGKRQVSFRPQHKLILLTNHKPHCDPNDYALWKRIHLIPFPLSFVDEPKLPNERKADPMLLDKLKAEASGILAWLVRGCLIWQKEGLNPPAIVKIATKNYQEEEDTTRIFISQCCNIGDGLEVQGKILYATYREWCGENGIAPMNNTVFGKQIKDRFDSYEKQHKIFYLGLNIISKSREDNKGSREGL